MTSAMQAKYAKPLPEMEFEERPYWESLREHAMKVQRCADCGRWCFPPQAVCPQCLSAALVWTPVTGRAHVYAVTNQYHAFLPGYSKEEVPYNVSIVELEEGVRVITNVIGCPVDQVKIGMPVEVVYDDVTDQATLAKFRPRPGGERG